MDYTICTFEVDMTSKKKKKLLLKNATLAFKLDFIFNLKKEKEKENPNFIALAWHPNGL